MAPVPYVRFNALVPVDMGKNFSNPFFTFEVLHHATHITRSPFEIQATGTVFGHQTTVDLFSLPGHRFHFTNGIVDGGEIGRIVSAGYEYMTPMTYFTIANLHVPVDQFKFDERLLFTHPDQALGRFDTLFFYNLTNFVATAPNDNFFSFHGKDIYEFDNGSFGNVVIHNWKKGIDALAFKSSLGVTWTDFYSHSNIVHNSLVFTYDMSDTITILGITAWSQFHHSEFLW